MRSQASRLAKNMDFTLTAVRRSKSSRVAARRPNPASACAARPARSSVEPTAIVIAPASRNARTIPRPTWPVPPVTSTGPDVQGSPTRRHLHDQVAVRLHLRGLAGHDDRRAVELLDDEGAGVPGSHRQTVAAVDRDLDVAAGLGEVNGARPAPGLLPGDARCRRFE